MELNYFQIHLILSFHRFLYLQVDCKNILFRCSATRLISQIGFIYFLASSSSDSTGVMLSTLFATEPVLFAE
eukprot:snap_masked-scaffold_54-processed-gene-0.2-mRNA-1 protein AED:1.00 eAED:1.00 QI:0/0/0/0/1/1/2/0/71